MWKLAYVAMEPVPRHWVEVDMWEYGLSGWLRGDVENV